MTSVKRRLVVSLTILLVMLVGSFGAVLTLQAAGSLGSQFDRNLLAKATTFAGTSEADRDGTLEFDFAEVDLPEFRPGAQAEYFQVWRWNDEVLARSRSLGEGDLPRLAAGEGPRFQDLVLPDGRSGRAVVLTWIPQLEGKEPGDQIRSGDTVLLVMARSREDLDGLLRNMLLGVLLAALVLPGIAGWLVRRVVVSGLRPLDRVASLASSIGSRQLSLRFPLEGLPEELRPICERLNGMIDRLRAAFERERRFTADAAHELRTPIAELRALAEVALRKAGDDESRVSFQDALDIAVQMGRLTESLLALARCESGRQEVEKRELDLSALLEEVAGASGLEMETDVPPAVRVKSDKALLTAILDNLFSNAASHSHSGDKVRLALGQEPDSIVLTLSNPCDSLDRDDLEHLFEPFWRKDPARSDGQHTGIGLSLVKAYADLLGVEVSAGLPGPERFEVTLRIPGKKPVS